MGDLFASGRIADLILAFTAIEAILLIAYFRATGRGIVTTNLLPNLAAGAFLMLALRCALTSAPWQMTATALAGALVSHLIDIYRRWHAL